MKITYRERHTQLLNLAGEMVAELKGMRTLQEMIEYYKNIMLNRG